MNPHIDKKVPLSTLMKNGEGLSGFTWPESCGDFMMRIASDGTWYYQNSPIGRKKLVQLFATTLQRDSSGQYWLVTPFERGLVEVEDAPFVIVEMQERLNNDNIEIHFRTNLDYWIRLDSDHPLTMRSAGIKDEVRPYIFIRDALEGLINRSVYYELVERSKMVNGQLILHSAGTTFCLGNMEEEAYDN